MEKFNQRLEALERNALLAGIANKKVLTTQEAAIYLGWSISYLYKKTSLKDVPHYCPMGKTLYFDREELENWLKRNRIASNNEILSKVQNSIESGRKGGNR